MPTSHTIGRSLLEDLLEGGDLAAAAARLQPDSSPLPPRVPGASLTHPDAVEKRWRLLAGREAAKEALFDSTTAVAHERYARNIENFIGSVKVPLGLAGPLRVNGLHTKGDYYVPLATSEAALVASYHRGALALSEAGGCTSAVVAEGVTRAPVFGFGSIAESALFAAWAVQQIEAFRAVAATTTRHGRLRDMSLTIEASNVYLLFTYLTGDASGQNMVTIATEAVCRHILETSPVKPKFHYLEANASGDKKASMQSFLNVRGRKVVAEAILPADLVKRRLRSTPAAMAHYVETASRGGMLTGTIGAQGHYANGLAALYIACGQDAACVAESAVGLTRFEVTEAGALQASVTLPNLIVGTVGGGTGLPSQKACLDILGLAGPGKARAFAEVAAALVLAGELSIIAALTSGDFCRAHAKLARGKTEAKPEADSP
jgi:hydroxymethylglutaryl-CoA reductase (NADPH)